MDSNNLYKLFKKLVSIKSDTNSTYEKHVEKFGYDYLKCLPYFEENPDYLGLYDIKDDTLGRCVLWALVKGEGRETMIGMHHHDVVDIKDFGELMPYAYDVESLPLKLKNQNLDEDAKNDLESGEWFFGRGSADMKSGMALHMNLIEEYSRENNKTGNLLFISVPDEESYSAGMRGAIPLLMELKSKYNLEYKLLHDSECHQKIHGKGLMSKGSIGKVLPIILAQGKQSHVCHIFEGLNPLGLISQFLIDTDLNPSLCDKTSEDTALPPTWIYLKDRKVHYDVSIPYKVCGYLNMNILYSSPLEILKNLKSIGENSFEKYLNSRRENFNEYKKINSDAHMIDFKTKVLTFEELCNVAKSINADSFNEFYSSIYKEIEVGINGGNFDYMEATTFIMEKVLEFCEEHDPVIVIALSPPFYPSVTSSKICGKENVVENYVKEISKYIKDSFGEEYVSENYFDGLSDLSFGAVNGEANYDEIKSNMPIWGSCYSIEFENIEKLNIPVLNLGPWGKDFHKYTERVNKIDLLEKFPKIYMKLLKIVLKK